MPRRAETRQSAESTVVDPSATLRASLRVHLLGPPVVEWTGQPLSIPRRQARALLYRLAARLKPVPREQLCFLFWPDTPESTARRNLSRLLYYLRDALPVAEVLLTSHDQVGLDPQRAWSDVMAFERLHVTPHGDPRFPPVTAATAEAGGLEALQRVVDLYRGPFLAGFSLPHSPEFEAWASLEQQTWERRYLEALSVLLEGYAARGTYDAAIACARRYVATDDLAEEVHRRLIELYVTTGDRSGALRQYEQCAIVLERELGVSPLPETQAAYQAAVQNANFAASSEIGLQPEGQPLSVRPAVSPSAWRTLPSLDAPLVGRDDALHRLEQAYARVRFGHGGVVLISGEAGIGKSRLIQGFATRQDQAGVAAGSNIGLVLVGAGHPGEQTMPYQPIVEALRSALNVERGPLRAQREWLAEASRLLPELRTLHPDLPPPLPAEPDEARARLFEALCQLILGLAAGPYVVLLCLDDLHWADSATLDWLAYLGRRLRDSRLLVIGSYQSEEADAMGELRHRLTRLGVLSEVKLAGLDTTAVVQLLRYLIGHVPGDEALADRLQKATGGNPFFLLETLRVLMESGQPLKDLAGLETLPLPDTVREAVETRLGRLSPVARQILDAGAILGLTFGFDLVRLTAGRGNMETVDALDELIARHLLAEQADVYGFRHQVIRRVVYQDLSYWRRRLLHRRAGETLEQLHPDDAAALAWHFEWAEEPRRAAGYALQAGLAAKAVFAHAEARACFDRALGLLEREAVHLREPEAITANRRLRIQALGERGWVLRLLGDMEAWVRDLQEEARLAEVLGDPRTLAHLRWREAASHRWFCRYVEAREAAEDGLCLSQAAADRLLEARCWRELGLAAREAGDYSPAQAALERALQIFVDLGQVGYEVHVLGNLSTLYWYMGEYEKAMDLARWALARCDEAGLPFHRRLPLGDMGAAAAASDTDQARQYLLESLSIARRIADRTQEILCLGHLGWLGVELNQPAQALKHLRAALALAGRIGSHSEESWLQSGLAEAHRLAGDPDQAAEHARRALELAQAYGRAYDQELAHRILTRLGLMVE